MLTDFYVQGAHLVTVTGAPGMGKTSLVQEFSVRCASENEIACETVVFCDLAGSRNEADVIATLSASLGLHLGTGEGSESSAEVLGRAMASRGRTLLILDTFEQVSSCAGNTIARWLDLAPEALFLVTSRNRLRVRG
jgi:predicted ATPase